MFFNPDNFTLYACIVRLVTSISAIVVAITCKKMWYTLSIGASKIIPWTNPWSSKILKTKSRLSWFENLILCVQNNSTKCFENTFTNSSFITVVKTIRYSIANLRVRYALPIWTYKSIRRTNVTYSLINTRKHISIIYAWIIKSNYISNSIVTFIEFYHYIRRLRHCYLNNPAFHRKLYSSVHIFYHCIGNVLQDSLLSIC